MMNYTLDRFPARDVRPITEIVKETMQLSSLSGSLGRLLENDTAKRKKRSNAKRAMMSFVAVANRVEVDEEENVDLFAKFLGRVVKAVGKKVVKTVVKHVLKFAGRMAWNVIRFAASAILRYVLMPVISFIVGVAVANPITAGVVAAGVLLGGAYYAWKKFFGKEPDKKQVVKQGAQPALQIEEVDTTNIAEQDVDIQELGTQAQVEGAEQVRTEVYERSVTDYIAAPVEAVKQFVAPKAKKGGKFTGFGEDVDGYIREASAMFPILPLDVFRGFVKMEAGWTGAMSPTGAIGTGQFIQSTWDRLADTPEGKALGMTKIGKRFRRPDDPRFDKRINTLATGLLAAKNAEMLKARGLPITGENLYMMHNIGPGIIPVMLGQPASEKTLLAMRQNGMKATQSASQFLEWQKGRFRVAYEDANRATTMNADQPQMASAITVDPPTKKGTTSAKASPKLVMNDTKQGTDLIRGPGKTIVRA